MNRKDKTVKQLQAECRKRKVGFMMNWTKIALVKRLEDEDKRELEIKKAEDKATKEINKAKKELEAAKIGMKDQKEALRKSDPKVVEKEIIQKMYMNQKNKLANLQRTFDTLHQREIEIEEENNKVAEKKLKIYREIVTIKELMANLK
jgi:hypothetical protein